MIYQLNFLCLSLQNHPITKALTCGERLSASEDKNLILSFGLLHLFVVSGAHAHFILYNVNKLNFLKKSSFSKLLILFSFTAMCDFSPPILKAFFQILLKKGSSSLNLILPNTHLILLASGLTLPFALITSNLPSLGLSSLFSFFHLFTKSYKSNQALLIYTLALPIFIGLLGVPHVSSVFILSVSSFIMGSVFLPLSFFSLFSDLIELLTVDLWRKFILSLNYLHVFFNLSSLPNSNFQNTTYLYLILLTVCLFCISGKIYWKRKTLFL